MDQSAVVLLDRYPIWLTALEALIQRLGYRVVGATTSPERAVELVAEHEPDVLVAGLELSADRTEDLACLTAARRQVPRLKTVVLGTSEDPSCIEAAFEAGAAAYVLRTAHPEDVATAIRHAFKQTIYTVPDPRRLGPKRTEGDQAESPLSPGELRVLRLVAEGRSNRQVAQAFGVTEQAVKFHLSNIYRKLGVSSRTEASRRAYERRLLGEPTFGTR